MIAKLNSDIPADLSARRESRASTQNWMALTDQKRYTASAQGMQPNFKKKINSALFDETLAVCLTLSDAAQIPKRGSNVWAFGRCAASKGPTCDIPVQKRNYSRLRFPLEIQSETDVDLSPRFAATVALSPADRLDVPCLVWSRFLAASTCNRRMRPSHSVLAPAHQDLRVRL
ncbi:hypothetical protein PHSY_000643 [Pseudozyma hubeiensis SY62]|uniref:Uncharacterized protein n=1 Tax=Pseudozyma hubeiensis (strain SY62) TaxID=1305764 RepID=R9NX35_PSEHS|nr:hypothetical protein PHSY_000643 [Pseudozyma hubeiensis SY62]GAC93082.1 hypothetical protein PHSY_000643 [Pseudozyma hubeiensis SY62]